MISSKSNNGTGTDYLTRWVLVPFYTIRLGLILFHICYLIYLLTLLVEYMDDGLSLYIVHEVRDGGFLRTILSAIAVAALGVCMVFELICIMKTTRGTLTTRFLLFSSGLQSVLWLAIFVPSMITYHDKIIRSTGIALSIALFALFFYALFAFYKQKGTPSYRTFEDDERTAFRQHTSYQSPRSMVETSDEIREPDTSALRYEPVREQHV